MDLRFQDFPRGAEAYDAAESKTSRSCSSAKSPGVYSETATLMNQRSRPCRSGRRFRVSLTLKLGFDLINSHLRVWCPSRYSDIVDIFEFFNTTLWCIQERCRRVYYDAPPGTKVEGEDPVGASAYV